jgi:hypothetical protein
MGKGTDMALAKTVVLKLSNIKIANPVAESEQPDAQNMSASLAAAAVAKSKFGLRPVKRDEIGSAFARENPKEVVRRDIVHTEKEMPVTRGKEAFVSSSSPEYIIAQGKDIIQKGIARCDQCAAAIIACLVELPKFTSSIEMIGNNHHAWIVCGRMNFGADINQIAGWGDTAFLIDIWVSIQAGAPDTAIDGEPRTSDGSAATYTRNWAAQNGLFVIRGWPAKTPVMDATVLRQLDRNEELRGRMGGAKEAPF